MSSLRIYYHNDIANLLFSTHNNVSIRRKLTEAGIRFEQWLTQSCLPPGASDEKVLAEFKEEIDQLIAEENYQHIEVVSLNEDHPDKDIIRERFLNEHTHTHNEIRLCLAGEGLLSLHIDEKVYEILCTPGDLIYVPANTPHWFDIGDNPSLIMLRLFNCPEGWEPKLTGNPISSKFNRLEK